MRVEVVRRERPDCIERGLLAAFAAGAVVVLLAVAVLRIDEHGATAAAAGTGLIAVLTVAYLLAKRRNLDRPASAVLETGGTWDTFGVFLEGDPPASRTPPWLSPFPPIVLFHFDELGERWVTFHDWIGHRVHSATVRTSTTMRIHVDHRDRAWAVELFGPAGAQVRCSGTLPDGFERWFDFDVDPSPTEKGRDPE